MNDRRPIPGHQGCYAAADGTILLPNGGEAPLVEKKKVHPKAVLPTPAGPVQIEVRRLMWVAWHGPIPKGHMIGHLNGNRFDNSIENLIPVPRKNKKPYQRDSNG